MLVGLRLFCVECDVVARGTSSAATQGAVLKFTWSPELSARWLFLRKKPPSRLGFPLRHLENC